MKSSIIFLSISLVCISLFFGAKGYALTYQRSKIFSAPKQLGVDSESLVPAILQTSTTSNPIQSTTGTGNATVTPTTESTNPTPTSEDLVSPTIPSNVTSVVTTTTAPDVPPTTTTSKGQPSSSTLPAVTTPGPIANLTNLINSIPVLNP